MSNPKKRGRQPGCKNKKMLEKEKEERVRLEKDKKDDIILKLRKSLAELENCN